MCLQRETFCCCSDSIWVLEGQEEVPGGGRDPGLADGALGPGRLLPSCRCPPLHLPLGGLGRAAALGRTSSLSLSSTPMLTLPQGRRQEGSRVNPGLHGQQGLLSPAWPWPCHSALAPPVLGHGLSHRLGDGAAGTVPRPRRAGPATVPYTPRQSMQPEGPTLRPPRVSRRQEHPVSSMHCGKLMVMEPLVSGVA